MTSELYPNAVGNRAGLATQDDPVRQILGFQDVRMLHRHFAVGHGAGTRTTLTFTARIGNVDAGGEQHLDEGGSPGPAQSVDLPVEIHFQVRVVGVASVRAAHVDRERGERITGQRCEHFGVYPGAGDPYPAPARSERLS